MTAAPIYNEIAISLYKALDTADAHDRDQLESIREMVTLLLPILDQKLPRGFMRELDLWCGLILDGKSEFKWYGDGIRKDYPDVFA